MNISISIPDEIVTKLEKRAADSGQSVQSYAARVVADIVTKPTVDEVLAPFRKQVADSGMNDEELDDFLRGELTAHRQEKKAKSL